MRRFATLRFRTTVAAVVVVGSALLIVALVVASLLRRTLTEGIDNTLEVRAETLALELGAGTPPASVASAPEEDSLTQVVDTAGAVVASSGNVTGQPALSPIGDGAYATLPAAVAGIDRVRVHARVTDDGSRVIVGTTLEGADDAAAVVGSGLRYGLPLVLALVATTTWIVVGRTLGPVEAIRAEVAGIGESDLHRRVPEPGSDDEIARLAVTMNEMLDRLEAASRHQKRFVSDASHELRTPIATIRHRLEVALVGGDPNWRDVAGEVLGEDLRMQRMVEDLLWLARNDHGPDRPDPMTAGQLVDVDEILFDEAERIRIAGTRSVDVSRVGAGQVRGEADELRRVVINLLDNAARHSDGRVAVTLRSDDESVRLTVEDDGPGIEPADRDRVFERFTRLDEARARTDGGVGLGLAITGEIVAAHGGTIVVATSTDLGGARFVATLPSSRQSEPSASGSVTAPASTPAGTGAPASAAVRSSSAST